MLQCVKIGRIFNFLTNDNVFKFKLKNTRNLDRNSLNLIRKLTQIVVISDGETEFEGGKCEFDPLHGTLDYDGRKQGSLVMFPSFLKHRILPITSGVRYAVNGWSYGPSWR